MHPVRALVLAGLITAGAGDAAGQVAAPRDSSPADTAVRPAPVVARQDLLILGGGAALAYLAHRADLPVRNEVRSAHWQDQQWLKSVNETGNAWGGGVALGLGYTMWLGGLWKKNEDVAAVGLRSLEAMKISGAVTQLLKFSFGRARPRVNPTDDWDVEAWRGTTNDYESFPSGHSSNAFSFAAAVTSEVAFRAPEKAKLVGAATFTLAGVTAYARMHSDAHWLSDVTMGAAIGMATGYAVTRFHQTRPNTRWDDILLGGARPFAVDAPNGRTLVGITVPWR